MSIGCGNPNYPGAIFADVFSLIDFIQDVLVGSLHRK